jgi:hypothetical protein
MAMSSATLSSELQNVVPEDTEADAIQNLASAFADYCATASALTTLTAAGKALGRAAFVTTAVGISASGAGAAKLVAAIHAFWTAVAGGLAASFSGATAIVPAFASLTSADLQPVFDSNTSSSASISAAASALATAIHAKKGGGTVTTPGPTVTPIT